jgi:hypothetical protein
LQFLVSELYLRKPVEAQGIHLLSREGLAFLEQGLALAVLDIGGSWPALQKLRYLCFLAVEDDLDLVFLVLQDIRYLLILDVAAAVVLVDASP